MRPHNTLFGERIIQEPRCAGACVPVFWLTLWEQAGPKMNQGWDAGLTPSHTRGEAAFALLADSPFAHVDTTWRMRQYSEFIGTTVWFWVAGVTTAVFEETDWRDRLQATGHLSVPETIWRSFCKTKKADTHFGRANEAFDIQPKISVSLLSALLTFGPSRGSSANLHNSQWFLMMLYCCTEGYFLQFGCFVLGRYTRVAMIYWYWCDFISTLLRKFKGEVCFFHWGHNPCDAIVWLAAMEVWTRPGSAERVTVHIRGAQWDKRESSKEESFESKLFLLDL